MSGLQQRANARASNFDDSEGSGRKADDPLAVLDENAAGEPLDNDEQRKVVEALREQNKKSSHLYRSAVLAMEALLFFFYLTPLPAYIMGTHPENHLTMFFSRSHGTHEDLYYLPALPIYLFFFAIQGTVLYLAAWEFADAMGIEAVVQRRKRFAYPAQPHPFGTAPSIFVEPLATIRWPPPKARADDASSVPTEGERVLATASPRVMYLTALTLAALPVPLMVFGGGSFANAGWWMLTPAVLTVAAFVEHSIYSNERSTKGLDGMRYNYKGA